MLKPRIIPTLLVQNGGLVKTKQFGAARYVGDPINAVKIFNEKEVDELIVLDIDASRLGVEPDLTRISHLAAECRMPLCYGGGVKTVEQVKRIVGLGVEKVAISSAAITNPDLIRHVANEVGSQSVVIVLDVRRAEKGNYTVWVTNGTRPTGRDAIEMATIAQEMGAGEIVVNSIDNDGCMKGYDLELAKNLSCILKVPLTILGGAGSLDDIEALARECGTVGAAAGSLFVFKGTYRAVLINYPNAKQKQKVLDVAAAVCGAAGH